MAIFKPAYTFIIVLIFSLSGFSQPVEPSIDSIIHLVTTESYRRHFDSLRTCTGCNRKVIEASFQSPDHDACRDYIYRTFKRYFGEQNVYLHRFKVNGNGGLANIVAYKEGKSHAKGILIISAHYDSNNSREESGLKPECSPGANDNGTGVAAVLEIARVLSGVETENSILFTAWDIEEQFPFGFAGGSNCWYTKHIVKKGKTDWSRIGNGGKINIENLIANINFDMFGHPNDTLNGKPVLWACSGNVAHSGFINEYISVFNWNVPEIAVINRGKMTYSDHFTFAARKIPSVENLESGYDNDPFYHTCSDNIGNNANINFDFAASVTRGGMAFTLGKSILYYPYIKRMKINSFPILVFEMASAYSIKLPVDGFRVQVTDQFGNNVNTFMQGGLTSFYPRMSGLYNIFIFSSKGMSSRNIYLQRKEGQFEHFFL